MESKNTCHTCKSWQGKDTFGECVCKDGFYDYKTFFFVGSPLNAMAFPKNDSMPSFVTGKDFGLS